MSKLQKNAKSFKSILDKLEIDETLTKAKPKQKGYNKFANSVVPEENFNYMTDLLQLPETDKGFKYLFVITDLATNNFDIEPIKNTKSESAVKALKAIVKRGILKLPEISIKSDGGSEFKGAFDKYLQKEKIYHSVGTAYRKTQLAPVERLNRSLARLLMNYLNKKEVKIHKVYMNWTDILPTIRTDLNGFRERDIDKLKKFQSKSYFDAEKAKTPEFNIGDIVHYKLMKPVTIRGHDIHDTKFREGDRRFSIDTKDIINILYYPDSPWYRYKLKGLPHISFTSSELKTSTAIQQDESTYVVKKIIGQKMMNKTKYYLVWWKKYLKKDATWEKGTELIKDGLQDYVDEYETSIKYLKKKR